MQDDPSEQGTQVPLLQTIPEPHEVPFGWLFDSVQTALPVVQTIVPVRQGLPVTVQLVPAAHGTHAPLLHTIPVPQLVPFPCA